MWSPLPIQPMFSPPSVSCVASLATPTMPLYASAWIRDVASIPVRGAGRRDRTALLVPDRLPAASYARTVNVYPVEADRPVAV